MNDTLAKLLTDDESVYEPTRLPEVFAYLAGLRDRLFAAASAAPAASGHAVGSV